MARFIPQHLFDGLVIYRLMATLADNDDLFNELMRKYRDAYPDEDFNAVTADVDAAAEEGRHLVRIIMDTPSLGERDEMVLLRSFLDVFREDAARGKPLWRRMLENYFRNVQPAPIPDRVEKARAHLVAAQKTLLARRMKPAAG
jgi:hypothetical protein